MRTLVALTVLMLALAGAVWWKTAGAGDGGEPAPVTDPGMGRLTMGIDGNAARMRDGAPPAVGGQPQDAGLGGGESAGPEQAGGAQGGGDQTTPPRPEPQPQPAPQPEAVPQPLRHVVKSGETMYRIVLNAYGTAPPELVRAVAAANGIDDPSTIDEGQSLTLPDVAGFPAPSAG